MAEIQANGYDLSINRYKEIEYEAVQYDPPKVILVGVCMFSPPLPAGDLVVYQEIQPIESASYETS